MSDKTIAEISAYVPMSSDLRSEAEEWNALVREALDSAWRAAEEDRRLTELYGPVLGPGWRELEDTPQYRRQQAIDEVLGLMDEYGLTTDDLTTEEAQ